MGNFLLKTQFYRSRKFSLLEKTFTEKISEDNNNKKRSLKRLIFFSGKRCQKKTCIGSVQSF